MKSAQIELEGSASQSRLSSVVTTLSVAVVPLLEFTGLRVFFHSGLKLKIGYMGMTDYDWVLPTVISFFLFMFCIERTKKAELKFNRNAAILNGLFVAGLCLLSTQYNLLFSEFGLSFKAIWLVLAVLTLLSACFLWVGPAHFLTHPDRRLLIPFFLLAGSKLISRHLFAFLWQPVLEHTGLHVYRLLKILFVNVNHKIFISALGDTFVHVSHPIYTVAIGSGCSGMEGISFGLFALLIFFFFEFRRFNALQWLFLAAGIAAWMYLLNVLRITVFFVISLMTLSSWGHDTGIKTALSLFHNSVGWILYTAGLFMYYKLVYSSVFARLNHPLRTLSHRLAAKTLN